MIPLGGIGMFISAQGWLDISRQLQIFQVFDILYKLLLSHQKS